MRGSMGFGLYTAAQRNVGLSASNAELSFSRVFKETLHVMHGAKELGQQAFCAQLTIESVSATFLRLSSALKLNTDHFQISTDGRHRAYAATSCSSSTQHAEPSCLCSTLCACAILYRCAKMSPICNNFHGTENPAEVSDRSRCCRRSSRYKRALTVSHSKATKGYEHAWLH